MTTHGYQGGLMSVCVTTHGYQGGLMSVCVTTHGYQGGLMGIRVVGARPISDLAAIHPSAYPNGKNTYACNVSSKQYHSQGNFAPTLAIFLLLSSNCDRELRRGTKGCSASRISLSILVMTG